MDLILTGGTVRSGHDGWQAHGAVAIRGGRIASVGTPNQILPLKGPHTRVLDVAGGCVLPGLTDAHLHILGYGLTLDKLALAGLPSLRALQAVVAERASARKAGEWIQGRGWEQEQWAEQRMPTRHDLDVVAPEHPAYLVRACGHLAVANSLALKLAGVGSGTPDPAGGALDRDEHGELIGLLRETAMRLVAGVVPQPDAARRAELLLRALTHCLELGITQVQTDDVLSAGGLDEALALFGSVAGPEGVPVRVTLMLPIAFFAAAQARGMGTGWGGEWLRLGHVKLFADGSLGGRTAALRAPYADDPSTSGIAIYEREEMFRLVAQVHRAGAQLGVHVIGDGASHLLLDAIQAAQQERFRPDHRHRLIHCQITGADTLQAYTEAGIVADIQPVFLRTDGHFYARRVGPERAATSYAWRTMLDLGIPACGGSDCPVEPLNPLWGIYGAVTRQDTAGFPPGGWQPEQRLAVAQALHLFTAGAAHATFEEGFRGALAPGLAADVTVLDRDPFAVSPSELKDLRVRATVVGGRVAYEA